MKRYIPMAIVVVLALNGAAFGQSSGVLNVVDSNGATIGPPLSTGGLVLGQADETFLINFLRNGFTYTNDQFFLDGACAAAGYVLRASVGPSSAILQGVVTTQAGNPISPGEIGDVAWGPDSTQSIVSLDPACLVITPLFAKDRNGGCFQQPFRCGVDLVPLKPYDLSGFAPPLQISLTPSTVSQPAIEKKE